MHEATGSVFTNGKWALVTARHARRLRICGARLRGVFSVAQQWRVTAMVLEDVLAGRVEVIGSDISARVLAQARGARYPMDALDVRHPGRVDWRTFHCCGDCPCATSLPRRPP